ncbi:uncharacterized protein TNCV_2586191 [Trichonephila clavipes]|nr:uncharacterized protein TNCV_2586191 [Trichonephila clavipes]
MEFEQRYFDLKLKFQDKIEAIDASRSINVSGQNISIAIRTEQSNADFRLPKLNIPVFSGKFEERINFKDLFVTAVHSQTSLGNIQKFQYFKGLLSDEPASLIKHIPLSNESYEEAWGKLIDRYDKKKQIVYALIETFLDQKGISQVNMTNLRNLVDTSDDVLRGLKELGTEATNRDPWLIQILMQKLDTETKRLWSVKTAEKDFPTLKEFLEFLNVRCSSLELMTCNDSDTKVPTKSNFIAEGIPLADEDFSKPSECDFILGSDCFFSILRNGRITGSKGQPIAQHNFWLGCSSSFGKQKNCLLKRFHYQRRKNFVKITLKQLIKLIRKVDSRVVKLPSYRDINQLGNTRGLEVSRLLAMENKFKSDVELEREYKNFMEKYEKLGHMSPNKELDGRISYFLPHHAVRRKDTITTKRRVVFDGSCKPPNSNSLNSVLGVG